MDASISAIIAKSLDGLALRSAAVAQNIANSNSASYRRLSVSFESALRDVAARGPDAIAGLWIETKAAANAAPGSAIRTDLELATASETAMRYGALIDILGRELQLQRAIIRGGQ